MKYEFSVQRRRIVATPEEVLAALEGVVPGRVRQDSVVVGTTEYPLRQAFAAAFRIPRSACQSLMARRVLGRLGFAVRHIAKVPRRLAKGELPPDNPPDAHRSGGHEPIEEVWVGGELLRWSWWYWWDALRRDGPPGWRVEVPICQSGVYEVKRTGEKQRLIIGRAVDLNKRLRHELVTGNGHAAGRKIRAIEDTSQLVVRWALTDRPAAIEEALHRRHIEEFGALPTYTERT